MDSDLTFEILEGEKPYLRPFLLGRDFVVVLDLILDVRTKFLLQTGGKVVLSQSKSDGEGG